MCARPISAWSEFGLEILEKILKYNFIVSPEIRFQLAPAVMDHLTGGLNADLLNHRQHGRGCSRIARTVREFYADLDFVNPIALERHNTGVIGGSDVPRVLVHGGHVEVVFKDRIDGGLPALLILVSQVLADGQFPPYRIAYLEAGLKGVRDVVGTESDRAGLCDAKQGDCTLKCAHWHSVADSDARGKGRCMEATP